MMVSRSASTPTPGFSDDTSAFDDVIAQLHAGQAAAVLVFATGDATAMVCGTLRQAQAGFELQLSDGQVCDAARLGLRLSFLATAGAEIVAEGALHVQGLRPCVGGVVLTVAFDGVHAPAGERGGSVPRT